MVIPKEHGTWMMFFLPVILGTSLTEATWFHLLYIIGWFFLFLASTPLLNIVRNQKNFGQMLPWLIGYSVIAVGCLIPVVLHQPRLLVIGACFAPLLAVNVFFIKKKNERSLINDICGIMIFSLGGVGAFIIGSVNFTVHSLELFVITTSYFLGVVFYVKSLIRERLNRSFTIKSHLCHLVILFVPFVIGLPYLVIAYIPSCLKDFLTNRSRQLKPMVIGIIEMINGVVFFVLCLFIIL